MSARGGKRRNSTLFETECSVPVAVAAGSRLDPPHVLLESELGQQRSEVSVGEQRHVVVAIPDDAVEAPGAREAAEAGAPPRRR